MVHWVWQLRHTASYPLWLYALLATGLLAQGVTLAESFLITGYFGFFQILSVSGFGCILTVALLQLTQSNRAFLQLWFVPTNILVVLVDAFFDNTYAPSNISMTGLVLHILLSITALSLTSVCSMLLLCGSIRNSQLKHPSGTQWVSIPAMETLKKLSRIFLLVAWLALTLAVVSGGIFVQNFLAQHLAHKTFFTLLAWLVLSYLLMRTQKTGLTWNTTFLLCLLVNILLLLGYFGTRFVLEFILR